MLHQTQTESEALKESVSRALLKTHDSFVTSGTATTLLQAPANVISFADAELNTLTGGLAAGTVTEIAGEAGAGKTQFCIQALVSVVTQRRGGGLIINTEGGLWPLDRVSSLSVTRPRGSYLDRMKGTTPAPTPGAEGTLDDIFVKNVPTADALVTVLTQALPSILQVHPIRLIIIDSVANLVTSGDMVARAKFVATLGALLKQIAHIFHVAVLVTNHARDFFSEYTMPPPSALTAADYYGPTAAAKDRRESAFRQVSPAMGPVWSHFVNTRLMITRASGGGAARELHVVYSDRVPVASTPVVVDEAGFAVYREPVGQEVAPGAASQWIY